MFQKFFAAIGSFFVVIGSFFSPKAPTTTISTTPTPYISKITFGATNTVAPTSKSTKPAYPTTTPNSPAPTNSCNYDLTSATGAVQIQTKPTSGSIQGTYYAELTSNNNCKVLDGKSTNNQRLYGTNPITYSSVPPGTYSARVYYNGNWSSTAQAIIKSGQKTRVVVEVAGNQSSPTITPTPLPQVNCNPPVILPSYIGNAPFQASICPSVAGGTPTNGFTTWWDFDGNGTWDQYSDLSCVPYTFSQPGTSTVKMLINNGTGQQSAICQTTVTVQ